MKNLTLTFSFIQLLSLDISSTSFSISLNALCLETLSYWRFNERNESTNLHSLFVIIIYLILGTFYYILHCLDRVLF